MPKKGHKVSEETRLRMITGAKKRAPRMIGKYGLTEETVREELAAGRIWCSDCKSFRDRNLFGNGERLVRCKDCCHKRNIGRYARNAKRYREERNAWRSANLEKDRAAKKDWQFASYGVTREWYEAKLAEQGGGCAICGATKPDNRSDFMYIDHRHSCCEKRPCCGKCVRGLLCLRCNSFVERLESNRDWAEKALAYLARYQ